ncbi:hypothetical protein BGW80DRAFT_1454770 [Lactifluus volemus]|nr:hypothetical protein BGW80DRAFT_1454770 [Lactifluus volemus]
MDPIYLDESSTSVLPYDQIEIDDDEEDQLASDTDEQPQITRSPNGEDIEPDLDDEDAHQAGHAKGATVNGKRKHPRKTAERVPGHTLLPATRLENILRADGESGPMSKEAQFALSIATEEFIKRFARAGHQLASAERRGIITYRDMATVAAQSPSLGFLEDVVPLPISLSAALEQRTIKEKERIDEDPALSLRPAPSPLPKPTLLVPATSRPDSSATTPTTTAATESPGPASSSTPSRSKGKSSVSNGRTSGARSKDKNKELSNGNSQPASEGEQKSRSRRSSRRSEPQGPMSTMEQPAQPPRSHPSGVQPQWQEPSPPRTVHINPNPQPWLAGPASGFLMSVSMSLRVLSAPRVGRYIHRGEYGAGARSQIYWHLER